MIDHVWTVLCSRAVVDRGSNNVSLENVIEQLRVRGKPGPGTGITLPLNIMTLWARSDAGQPAKSRQRIRFVAPSGDLVGEQVCDIDLTEHQRARSRGVYEGLLLEHAGRYRFLVDIWDEEQNGWRQVAAVPIDVIFESPQSKDDAGI